MSRIRFSASNRCIAATGAELKNTLCITHNGTAHLTGCFGDLGMLENFRAASEAYAELAKGLKAEPQAVACDMHPDFQAGRLAGEIAGQFSAPLIHVQHHHAHIAAVMAEHGLSNPVIGLALDGSGFGTDGTSWGGECLYVDAKGMQRLGCLKPVSLPGGDAASREPWRMAAAFLFASTPEQAEAMLMRLFPGEDRIGHILTLCASPQCRKTSSTGRLFDAAAAIILGHVSNVHEAEAAMNLESTAATEGQIEAFLFEMNRHDDLWELDFSGTLWSISEEKLQGADTSMLAGRFHATLASGLAAMVAKSAEQSGISDIVLSGGCLANRLLCRLLKENLKGFGFRVWMPERLSPGDAAISLGQAWVAANLMEASHA